MQTGMLSLLCCNVKFLPEQNQLRSSQVIGALTRLQSCCLEASFKSATPVCEVLCTVEHPAGMFSSAQMQNSL